jgi:dihydropteroate synthase
MGVVNVTPDSFSDGGRFLGAEAAIAHARLLLEQGADILDIGGESTRPGAEPATARQELERILPVVKALAADGATISIDTMKPEVMRAAAAEGATIWNDVAALRFAPAAPSVA